MTFDDIIARLPKPCSSPEYWTGCYSGNYDLITDESVAHPAKAAPGLMFRIFEHLKELGLLKDGDTVVDPMAGTGMTGLVAATLGYKSILVELEPKFVSFIQANVERLSRKLGKPLDITVIQGNSRQLSTLLAQRGLVACTSPPYGDSLNEAKNTTSNLKREERLKVAGHEPKEFMGGQGRNASLEDGMRYSDNPFNIGTLKDRPIVVTSPPFLETQTGGGIAQKGYRGPHIDEMGKNQPDKVGDRCGYVKGKQGQFNGQIANLKDRPVCVTSPPHFDTMSDWDRKSRVALEGQNVTYSDEIGKVSRENIGNIHYYDHGEPVSPKYSRAKEGDETYQDAMLVVYSEIAKVASVLVVVTKNPTRAGKLRRLDLDTQAMMEAANWTIRCHHKSILFEERRETDLFGNTKKKVKGRLGFFKRLSWQKGSEVAQWEDVFVAVNGNGQTLGQIGNLRSVE